MTDDALAEPPSSSCSGAGLAKANVDYRKALDARPRRRRARAALTADGHASSSVEAASKTYRHGTAGARARGPCRARRRIRGAPRPVGLRQDDAAAHGGRTRRAHRGRVAWCGQPVAAATRDARHGVPGADAHAVGERRSRNVRLPLDLARATREDADARAAEALAGVGLAEAGAQLSARALGWHADARLDRPRAGVQPALLLMDEPFAALDEFTRHRLDDDLVALWHARGLTVAVRDAQHPGSRVPRDARGGDGGARPGRVSRDLAIDGPHRARRASRQRAIRGACAALPAWSEA